MRAHLREHGLDHLIERITTGRKRCRVSLRSGPDNITPRVADALRMLWTDADQRVRVLYTGLIFIDKEDFTSTAPNTPEGLAYLQAIENDRNTALTLAKARGQHVATNTGRTVRYQPRDDEPRRPWVDLNGNRHTPFQVFRY